jgi:uncharacterized protein
MRWSNGCKRCYEQGRLQDRINFSGAEMKVRFGEIPEEGLRYEINDESWFPDHDLNRSGPVRSVVVLKRNGVDRVLLTGEIHTAVAFDCDRCLENFTMAIDNDFSLDLEYSPGSRQDPSEHECSPSEMDMIYLKEPVVDIFEILTQQIFLMIPEKVLCSESCKGLCPRCGINLNQEKCDCKQDLSSSPFAVLKR